jgi:hypothetical protein
MRNGQRSDQNPLTDNAKLNIKKIIHINGPLDLAHCFWAPLNSHHGDLIFI